MPTPIVTNRSVLILKGIGDLFGEIAMKWLEFFCVLIFAAQSCIGCLDEVREKLVLEYGFTLKAQVENREYVFGKWLPNFEEVDLKLICLEEEYKDFVREAEGFERANKYSIPHELKKDADDEWIISSAIWWIDSVLAKGYLRKVTYKGEVVENSLFLRGHGFIYSLRKSTMPGENGVFDVLKETENLLGMKFDVSEIRPFTE